ncbi:cysteine three histidine 1 [Stigmatopora argus]
MIKANGDSLLPTCHDEELVDELLSGDGRLGGGVSLVKSLLPASPPPSALVPWVCSTRYKTELCASYASAGWCRYAERCSFAHGLRDLHIPFRHPKYKTELCRSYHGLGRCHYGSRCAFAHDTAERRAPPPSGGRRAEVPCRTYAQFGACPYGRHCRFLHRVEGVPKARGALCYTFSSFGFCPYGTWCRFRHILPDAVTVKSGSGSAGPPSPALDSLPASPSPSASPRTDHGSAFSGLLLPVTLRQH